MEEHFLESSLREKVLEHLFVGDLLRCFWRRDVRSVELMRGEVDRGGYDLVLEYNNVIRHIQLKSSYNKAKTSRQKIHVNLSEKPSGCVVWLQFNPDSMELGPFLWFGGLPGEKLPCLGDKIAKHNKGNKDGYKAERPNHRILNKGQFKLLKNIDEVADCLFDLGCAPQTPTSCL